MFPRVMLLHWCDRRAGVLARLVCGSLWCVLSCCVAAELASLRSVLFSGAWAMERFGTVETSFPRATVHAFPVGLSGERCREGLQSGSWHRILCVWPTSSSRVHATVLHPAYRIPGATKRSNSGLRVVLRHVAFFVFTHPHDVRRNSTCELPRAPTCSPVPCNVVSMLY